MPEDAGHELTYDDLLRIVELVKASKRYAHFHLKIGDFEIELRRRDPQPGSETAASSTPSR